MNLWGWNRRWMSRWQLDSSQTRLMLHFEPRDRTVKHGAPDVDCWVRSPDGSTAKHRPGGRSFRGQYDAVYPDDFDNAAPLTLGRYRVTWIEQAGPREWREVLTHRLSVTDGMLPMPGS